MLHKSIDRPEDGYSKKEEKEDYLTFIICLKYTFLLSSQPPNKHRNLGHPSMEKQMRQVESAELDELPDNTRQQLLLIVKHCYARRIQRSRPRPFLFSIEEPIVRNFNHMLQLDVFTLVDSNVLHILYLGTGFQNGFFPLYLNDQTIWRMLRKHWINMYFGAPDYISSAAGTNKG